MRESEVLAATDSAQLESTSQRNSREEPNTLPHLRFEVAEAARILRLSRATLYIRIRNKAIAVQKDGARTYITRDELERYVASCD